MLALVVSLGAVVTPSTALTNTVNGNLVVTTSPIAIRNATSNITLNILHNISGWGSIYKINITLPTGFTLKDITPPSGWFIDNSTTQWVEIKATGSSELSYGQSIDVKVEVDPSSASPGFSTWTIKAYNVSGGEITASAITLFDNASPTITYLYPSGVSCSGAFPVSLSNGYIWANVSISDTYNGSATALVNLTQYPVTPIAYAVDENGNRYDFSLIDKESVNSGYTYKYNFGISNLPDGYYTLYVNATDSAGNQNSVMESIYVDKTRPNITSIEVYDTTGSSPFQLKEVNGTFYMTSSTTSVAINVTVFDKGITSLRCFTLAEMKVNDTVYDLGVNGTENNIVVFGTPGRIDVSDSNLLVIYWIDVIDEAGNEYNLTGPIYIIRDTTPPSAPSFGFKQMLGGVELYNISATDNVGISGYKICINGNTFATVDKSTIESSMGIVYNENEDDVLYAYDHGVLILNLSAYSDQVVNLSIRAIDYGSNVGNMTTVSVKVFSGEWYPVELAKGWNLISLPLVPGWIVNGTASYGQVPVNKLLEFKLGGNVEAIYGWNATAQNWVIVYLSGGMSEYPYLSDGQGYWFYAEDPAILIVQGYRQPPTTPPTPLMYDLYKGWNLVGFTSTSPMAASEYLSSLKAGTYFEYLFLYQNGRLVSQEVSETTFEPGEGFWLYMYENATLIPPLT